MGFNRIQSAAGISAEEARETALFLAERSLNPADGWELLEECGLVPYEPYTPKKAKAEHAAVIKHNRPGQ